MKFVACLATSGIPAAPARLRVPLACRFLLAAAAPCCVPIATFAQALVLTLDVPAGPLDAALKRVGRQAGVEVQGADRLADQRTDGIHGDYSLPSALEFLLRGSRYSFAKTDTGYAIVPAGAPPSATLAPVVVKGKAAVNVAAPYAGGQVARGARQGLLGDTDVFSTPFSTKAYTAQLMLDQGARTLDDVVANDASIRTSLSSTAPLDQNSIRGFVSYGDGYLFDGMPGLNSYSSYAVLNYERLEVLKGPSAGLNGAGAGGTAIGGSFNLVPKRATDAPVRSATVSVVDGALLGTHVDLGQRFGVDGAFGVRLNVTTESGHEYNDAFRRAVDPLLALDYRGERLRVTLDLGTVDYTSTAGFTNRQLASGATLPAPPDPRLNPNAEWETLKVKQAFGLAKVEWDFAPDWTAYARYGRFHEVAKDRPFLVKTPIASDGSYQITGYANFTWRQDNQAFEVGARGRLRLGETTHQLAFNVLQDREEYHDERYFAQDFAAPIAGSIYTQPTVPYPFPNGEPRLAGSDYAPVYVTSFAVADTVSLLHDRLLLTLSARRQAIKNDGYDQFRVTPTVAALYKLGQGVSVYGNYAEALAQGETAPTTGSPPPVNAGQSLAPSVARQHEFGLKWDQGTYGITAAYFDIRKVFALTDADNVFRAGGLQRNRGVELETFGEPLAGLRVLGGVAWIDAVQSQTEGGATDGKRALGVPRFNLSLGVEKDLPWVPGAVVTARVIHADSAFVDTQNTQVVPAWNRVDVGARYKTVVAGRPLTLRAGVDNLLDRTYWTIGGRNYVSVAPPRTWKLSTTMDF